MHLAVGHCLLVMTVLFTYYYLFIYLLNHYRRTNKVYFKATDARQEQKKGNGVAGAVIG